MGDAFRVGLGGPVGAGKTSLTASLCKVFSESLSMAVITNDIYTKEDAEILMKKQVINSERILAVETGGCPHTAIRERMRLLTYKQEISCPKNFLISILSYWKVEEIISLQLSVQNL